MDFQSQTRYTENRLNDMPKEFLSSDLRSFRNICLLGSTGAIFLFGILDFITDEKVIGSTTVSIFLLPFFPIFLLIKLTSRIKLCHDFVEKKTMTRRTRIKLKDVKSFGVFVELGPFMPKMVDPVEADKHSFLAENSIFISTTADFDPVNRVYKESIVFGYRKSVYDDVRELMEITDQSDANH